MVWRVGTLRRGRGKNVARTTWPERRGKNDVARALAERDKNERGKSIVRTGQNVART